jgi:hypothetical protein
MFDYLCGQVDQKKFFNRVFESDPNQTMNQVNSHKFMMATKPETIGQIGEMQRLKSEAAAHQLSEAVKISMELQKKKQDLHFRQMENIKEVWSKTI